MPRLVTVALILLLPFICPAAEDAQHQAADNAQHQEDAQRQDDARPACGSHNQGQLWPEAANHDAKLMARLIRCGELFLCVRGTWHYHWESPSVRLDQLGRGAKFKASKPSTCAIESVVTASLPDAEASDASR